METIIYAAGVAILLMVIVSFISATYDWYRTATIASRVDAIGATTIEHMMKNIRGGQSIDTTNSSFGTTTGALSIVDLVNSATITRIYGISNGRITYKDGTNATQYLTPTDLTISRFYITNMTNAISEAVRLEMDVTYRTKIGTTTKTYATMGILRNSY